MKGDEGGREGELRSVDFEELVDSVFGFARRVPVGLLTEVVLIVLRTSLSSSASREKEKEEKDAPDRT
jgi:hypothetical protein